MITKIFYFSTTGNSLYVARTIAGKLGETEIISIPKVIKGQINTDSESVGIIFPVYAWGLPRIVAEFTEKLKLNKNQYVFAIATCIEMPGATLGQLNKILNKNGSHLNAGFLIRENFRPNSDNEMSIVKFIKKATKIKPIQLKGRLQEITDILKNKKKHKLEMSAKMAQILGNSFHKVAIKKYMAADLNYKLDEKCNLCGICIKICPRENIKMENGKILWNQNCEGCQGCYQWCPKEAIHLTDGTDIKVGYHHPEIVLGDIVLR